MFFQSYTTYVTALILFATILIPVSHCVFITAFCSDLENDVHILNEIIKIESEKKKKLPADVVIEIKRKFSKIIQFQCDAKQLSGKDFSNTYSKLMIFSFVSII